MRSDSHGLWVHGAYERCQEYGAAVWRDDPWGEFNPFDVSAAGAEDLIDDGDALFEDLDGGQAGVGRVAVHHFEALPLMRNTHGERRDGDDHDARAATGHQLVDILAQPPVALACEAGFERPRPEGGLELDRGPSDLAPA